MRVYFFWDDPLLMVASLLYQFFPTYTTLAPALALAWWARRRIAEVDTAIGSRVVEYSIDGAGAAAAILEAGQVSGRTIVTATGPLANFYDPFRKELRLSKAVFEARTPEALGIASHEAGHALQDAQGYWLARARPPLIIAAKLGSGVGWMTLLAGVLMISPDLCFRGALLYSASVLGLLTLQIIEADANRRSRAIQPIAGLGESLTPGDQPFLKAFEAARWSEIASTLPRPQGWWSKRPA